MLNENSCCFANTFLLVLTELFRRNLDEAPIQNGTLKLEDRVGRVFQWADAAQTFFVNDSNYTQKGWAS